MSTALSSAEHVVAEDGLDVEGGNQNQYVTFAVAGRGPL